MRSSREAFGLALVDLAEKYDFSVFDADLSKATQTCKFAAKYPDRFYNMGISEGDMMTTAAGMASCGYTVFASTFALFAAGRAYEQIRNSIAYNNLNVKIAATHGGVLIGADGASHQSIEDIALMRVIPNMRIIVPCDEVSTKWAVEAALNTDGPVYLRFNRLPSPEVYKKDAVFTLGKANVVFESGRKIIIMAIGDMVSDSIEAARTLTEKGYQVAVADMHTVKPIDREFVCGAQEDAELILTVEDHSIIGGLGGAVAELMAEERGGTVLKRIGVNDVFGCSGTKMQLKEKYGLNAEHIVSSVVSALSAR